MVNTICGTILNISVHYKHGKIGKAITKQQILEGLIESGFSPTIQSSTWFHETIEKCFVLNLAREDTRLPFLLKELL